MKLQALLLLVTVTSAGPLSRDERLKRAARLEGKVLPLSATLEAVGLAAGRPLLLSEYVEDREAFVAIPGGPAVGPLEALPALFGTEDMRLSWGQWRYRDPAYALVPVGRTAAAEVRLAQRQVERTLQRAPRLGGQTGAAARKPARYDLLRSLSPALRTRAIDQAVRTGRAILPLSLFPPALVSTATGRLTGTRRLPDGSREQIFSWKDVAAGRGFVEVSRFRHSDGSNRLRLTIGAGDPPPSGVPVTGPTVSLNFETDRSNLQSSVTPDLRAVATEHKPGDRVTIYAGQTLRKKETPLANVLRQFADSSGRPVVCRWPTGDVRAKERLPVDLIDQPIERTLVVIRDRYGLEGKKGDPCVTFRPEPKKPAKTSR